MTYEKLLKIVQAACYFGEFEAAAESVYEFGEANEITPAMQDEIEEAVRAGATARGQNPDILFHFFETELEIIKVDRGLESPFKIIYRHGQHLEVPYHCQDVSAAKAVDKFRKLYPHPKQIVEMWRCEKGDWVREI